MKFAHASLLIMVLFGVVSISPWVQACPTGSYNVEGWNPGVDPNGPSSYKGTAEIQVSGAVCHMTWKIGEQSFGGVGFFEGRDERLNIAYADLKKGWFGLVSYLVKDVNVAGKWAVYGDKSGKYGSEILTKK